MYKKIQSDKNKKSIFLLIFIFWYNLFEDKIENGSECLKNSLSAKGVMKMKNKILKIISIKTNLKQVGDRLYRGKCPFCGAVQFYVFEGENCFHCFNCGSNGDQADFMHKYNVHYKNAVGDRNVAKKPYNLQKIYKMNYDAANFFYKNLFSKKDTACLDYLINKRKLTVKTICNFRMGYADKNYFSLKEYMLKLGYTIEELLQGSLITVSKNDEIIDFFNNRAVFPFIDLNGNIIGFGGRKLDGDNNFKYLNSKNTPCYSKNNYLFSLNFAMKKICCGETPILCEGNLDVISLHQAGFRTAIASCGTSLTENQAALLKKYSDKVIICYDNDEAGKNAADKAIDILEKAGLETYIVFMSEAKDPDEYIKEFGSQKFYELIKNSTKDPIYFRMSRIADKYDLTDYDAQRCFLKEVTELSLRKNYDPERTIRETFNFI
ncbi:putative DNA primase [Ruminococcus albus 8]|uniref:Putative DNA primase n=2 Tax=Ruminococcus albus TaxID=1264 RepID=E9S8B6_RUMAL|nr:putative DNA primase [Ruminococcus albus 8]